MGDKHPKACFFLLKRMLKYSTTIVTCTKRYINYIIIKQYICIEKPDDRGIW